MESGVDVVLNHRLAESFAFGDKKSYTQYLKDYMKRYVISILPLLSFQPLLHLHFFLNYRLVTKMEENKSDEVDLFKSNINKIMKDVLGRFKDLQFFTGNEFVIRYFNLRYLVLNFSLITGESMDIDGMVAMMEYREINGDSVPVLMYFKHGLEEEKF